MVQGIYYGCTGQGHAGNEVFLYEGNRMPSAAELAGTPVGDFRQIERNTGDGYVREMVLGEYFDIIPSVIGGGATSYWADYFYQNKASGQLGLWGGNAYLGPYAGLGFAYSYVAWSDSSANIGSRLAYYGPLEIVTGAELVASV